MRALCVVVLAFAYPQKKNGVFGAYTYVPGIDFASVDQLAAFSQMFGYGYWYCVGDDFESHLYVALGTANYTAKSYASVTYEHGEAWSQMVVRVNNWFTGTGCPTGCSGQVTAAKLVEYLKRHPEVENCLSRGGTRRYLSTDLTPRFQQLASLFMGRALDSEVVEL